MDSLSEYFSSNQSVVKFPESGSIDLLYVYKSYLGVDKLFSSNTVTIFSRSFWYDYL